MNILHLIILGIWLMLPAYVPNPAAALFGGGAPIDLGKKLKDGYRIFGDGKTFRGLIAGTLCGIVIGLIQNLLSPMMGLPSFVLPALVCLSFGALLGDLCKSFFKRRFGLRRGASLPVVDQLDLVFGSWLLCFIFVREWFLYNFNLQIIVVVLVMTPLLHISMNVIGYKMGVKKEPW
jgi:CDP-diglyceride synthetase